jgi:serine/threonine protein kinase
VNEGIGPSSSEEAKGAGLAAGANPLAAVEERIATEESRAASHKHSRGADASALDDLFSEFLARRMRGERFDLEEIWARAPEGVLRSELRRLMENYVRRVEPGLGAGVVAGQRLGKFQVLGELGRGGMGIVYLAYDESLKRRVALKVLPFTASQQESSIKRFLREAEAAAGLRHRNIIPIHSAGEVEGTYYYAMEYVPGITLAELIGGLRTHRASPRGILTLRRIQEEGEQVLRLVAEGSAEPPSAGRGPLEEKAQGVRVLSFAMRNYVREAARLFAEVSDALDYAHKQGVVHRDVKPSNLILAPDGRLLLADFGLAKIGGAGSITHTGELMGSPSYMSPEQAMGRRIPVDHRTDIWSLGVTLYELLTLSHPFGARSVELALKAIITLDPRPLRKVNPRLPKDIETIVLKTLEKDPDRRYASAAALAEDLRSFLNYEAIQAKTAGPLTRSLRFARRHVTWLAIGLLSITLLVVGTWSFNLFRDRARRDLARHFSLVEDLASRQANPLHDEATVEEIQRELLREWERTRDLPAAIDQLGMKALSEVRADPVQRPGAGELRRAMAALAKTRLILFHNPDPIERGRVEKVDRASADVRLRLIWRIAEAWPTVGEDALRVEELWGWLRMFLGTEDVGFEIRETNPLVRINAIEAMRSLDPVRLRIELGTLLRREPRLDPKVERAAAQALASLANEGEAVEALDLAASLVRPHRYPPASFLTRYHVLKALRRAPDPSRYRDIFEQLQTDEEHAIQALAEEALSSLKPG